jgi:Fe-S-cluster containining protein
MELKTDIKTIEKLAAEKEDQNWRFRCFVKGSDMEIEQLDAIVHKLNESVSTQIDCQTCGNCCRVVHPILKQKDIERLASHLSLPESEFSKKYLIRDEEEDGFTFRNIPCPFLSDNSCTVYSVRPGDCRSYPHLHKKEFFFRINGVFSNCSICPIVYNVYELLKNELHRLGIESFFEDYEYEGVEQQGPCD